MRTNNSTVVLKHNDIITNQHNKKVSLDLLMCDLFSFNFFDKNSSIDLFINKIINEELFGIIGDCETLIFDFSKSPCHYYFWSSFVDMFFYSYNKEEKWTVDSDDLYKHDSDFNLFYENIPSWIKLIKIIPAPYNNNLIKNAYNKDGSLSHYKIRNKHIKQLNDFMETTNGTKIMIDVPSDDLETFNKSIN